MSQPAPADPPSAPAKGLLADLKACLRFYSRLPVPVSDSERRSGTLHGMPDFRRIVRVLPLAGAVIALPAVLALTLATTLGLPPALAATLAIATLVLTTGAFHEDGLADSADAFGGMTRARKLDIMKDSRIGTFGGAALILSLGARIAALAAILSAQGAEAAAAALIACAAVARMCGLAPLVLLPPARSDGAAWAADKPAPGALVAGSLLALAIAVVASALGSFGTGSGLMACAVALAAALAMTWVAQRQIQGQTGDTAGAAEQLAEIAFLSVLASAYAA